MNKQELIEKYILDLIEQRVLTEGERVSSVREMAKIQNTSITPVIAAYEHLEMLGVLKCRPQSGFFVAKRHENTQESVPSYIRLFDVDTDEQSVIRNMVSEVVHDPAIRYPFAPTQMPLSLTDRARLAGCIKQSLNRYTEQEELLSYCEDSKALTAAIVQWMDRNRWLNDPKQIRVTTGIMQSLQIAFQACLKRSDAVAIESPGNSHFYFAAKIYGVRIVPIPSDPDTGLDLDCFESAVGHDPSIRCVLCAPNYSNPTGAFMPTRNKQRLLRFCEKHDIAIIEDDIAGDLSYKTLHPLPIKATGSRQVIYISGFENSIVHMSYISGGKYQHRISGFAELNQAYVPLVIQEGAALYLQSPQAKKHMRFVQEQLCQAMETVRGAVVESFPEGSRVSSPRGGRFLWVELPKPYNILRLLNEARKHGVSFSPGPVYSVGNAFDNCMRLNCAAAVGKPEMLEGIRILAELIRKRP